MGVRRIALAILAAALLPAEVPREVLVLARTRQKAAARLEKLADYTCLQTIERWTKGSRAASFRRADTIRLEVAHIGGEELYSWPGAGAFGSSAPYDFIPSGMISSGAFASFLRSAFLGGAVIAFTGEEVLNGRRVFRYGYSVPAYLSRFIIDIEGAKGDAGKSGSFWTDPGTFDVLRLEVRAMDIPPNVPVSSLVTVIDYAPVRIGTGDAWLPQTVDQTVTFSSGRESRNVAEFSHCRAYSGEAAVRFGPEELFAPPAVKRPVEIELPAGLALPLELETEVDSERAAVGDPLIARVREDVPAGPGLVIPKGAAARGRLRMLVRESAPVPHFLVGLEFTGIEFPGGRALFYARLERDPDVPGVRRFASRTSRVRLPEVPGVSAFFLEGARFRLPQGLAMAWRTQNLR